MEEKVLKAIEKFGMLNGVKNVTVALSGGADSMCLLYMLLSVKDRFSLNINAAHLNHLIRGKEAARDEEFVKTQCAKLGVELFSEKADVPRFAQDNKISIELAARQLRYDFLKRVSSDVVATAHTASDNIETVLLNLTRGTSLKGLCGIPPKRDMFIRPLIYCTRSDIEEYCKKNNISFIVDSTNLSDEYTRNNIRHNVVPVLKQINPAVEANVIRMCEGLSEEYSFIELSAQDYLSEKINDNSLDLSGIADIDKSVAKQALSIFISGLDYGIELNSFHLEKLYSLAINGGKAGLPGNYSAISNGRSLKIQLNNLPKIASFKVEIVKSAEKFTVEEKKINNLLLNNAIDYDRICGKLVIRTRLPGDSIRLAKRGNTKTLKKLYNEMHIPLNMRESLPVVADDKGVIWIYGIGVAERCSVTEKSKNICFIKAESGDK